MVEKIKHKWIVIAVLPAFMTTGCSMKMTVDHYPNFYKPSLKTVAVLPFENETSRKGLGIAAAFHLSSALAANGTYKVTGPGRLGQLLKEKGMPALPKEGYKVIADELAELGTYQAFLVGRVLTGNFTSTIAEYYDEDDFYDDDFYDGGPFWFYPDEGLPYWYYPFYYEYGGEVYVSASVSMVEVPDRTVLNRTVVKATADIDDRSPLLKKYGVQVALNKLSDKIVRRFAVVPVKITVNRYNVMRTADSLHQEKWHFTKTFRRDQESMYIVLCLPAAAAMNQFKLTITPKNNPSDVIASKDYPWKRDRYCQGVEFSPRQIARSNGPGKYSVHFYSRGNIVITRHFQIK